MLISNIQVYGLKSARELVPHRLFHRHDLRHVASHASYSSTPRPRQHPRKPQQVEWEWRNKRWLSKVASRLWQLLGQGIGFLRIRSRHTTVCEAQAEALKADGLDRNKA